MIFKNCYKFNKVEDDVSLMCKDVENVINEKLKKLPSEVNIKSNIYIKLNPTFKINFHSPCQNKNNLPIFQEVEIDKNPTKKSSKFGSKKSNVGNGPLARAGSTTSAVGKGSVESSPSNSAPSESAAAVLDFFHNATLQGALNS